VSRIAPIRTRFAGILPASADSHRITPNGAERCKMVFRQPSAGPALAVFPHKKACVFFSGVGVYTQGKANAKGLAPRLRWVPWLRCPQPCWLGQRSALLHKAQQWHL